MKFNIAGNGLAYGVNDILDLSWSGDSNSVGDADAIHIERIHCRIDSQELGHWSSERVLAGETYLDPLALQISYDFTCFLDNSVDAAPVADFAQLFGGRKEHVDSLRS